MTFWQTAIMVGLFGLGSFAIRAVPFALFPKGKPTPRYIVYIGKVLPFAITTMLIVYCLKEIPVLTYPYGIPEVIAIAVVAGSYLLFKNSLISIAVGTVLYMGLVQLVFV